MGLAIPGEHPFEHRSILCTQPPPAVDDQHQAHQRFAHIEIMFHQLQPFDADSFRDLREPISRQIHQTLIGLQLEKIDELGAPGRAADAGQAGALRDGVDGGGFTRV